MGSWEIGSWGRRVGRGWELVVGGSCWGAGSWELLRSWGGHASRFRVKVMKFLNFGDGKGDLEEAGELGSGHWELGSWESELEEGGKPTAYLGELGS